MARFVCTKRFVRSLLLPALVAGFSACADREPVASSREDIAIGVIAPVDSRLFRSGPPTVEGISLAVKQINAEGGVTTGDHRRKIRLLVENTDGRPELAVSKAFKLIDSDKAVALIGLPVSDSALAVSKVAEERRVHMISTVSTHPETTRDKRFVFRVIFHDAFQGRVMAQFAYRELGARKAGLLFDPGSAYSRGLAQAFRAAFEQQGGEVTVQEGHTADDSDASDRLLRIRQADAGVLVYRYIRPCCRP